MLKTIFENIISVITVVCCLNGATEVHNKMLQQTESALQTYVLQR